MDINQARKLARHGAMVRSFRETERMMRPFTIKYEPPPPFFQNNSLVCHHCKLAWDACVPCRRTKENAMEQTKDLRAQLGIEGFDL